MQHFQLVTTLKNDLQEVVCTCIYEVDLSERRFENFAFFFLHPLYILFQSKSKKRKLEEVKESAKRRQKMVDDDMDIVEGNEKSELTRYDVFHILGVLFLC